VVFPLRGLREDECNYPCSLPIKATAAEYENILQELESNLKRTDWTKATVNELLKILEAITSYHDVAESP